MAAVIAASLHVTEAREFAALAEHAEPWWLSLAVVLQALTYLAAGQVFRAVAAQSKRTLDRATAYRLSLVKLFVDQALPSGGLSGTLALANGLEREGLPRSVVSAGVVVDVVSYYAAYAAMLGLAASIAVARHADASLALGAVLAFALFAGVLIILLLRRSGSAGSGRLLRLRNLRTVRKALEFVEQADPSLVHSRTLLVKATACQVAIFALDAASMWALLRAVGSQGSVLGVFASFMLSTLLRTVAIMPGGLGAFEAASVLTLRLVGVPTAEALAATLLFRGLSFWVPMLPGLWFSKKLMAAPSQPGTFSPGRYWERSAESVLGELEASPLGLSSVEAERRLHVHGKNALEHQHTLSRLVVLWNQLRSPLLLLLLFASIVSALSREWSDASMVGLIVLLTVTIGYTREYGAQAALAALGARLRVRANVLRDGRPEQVAVEDVVPGDVVLLAAGSLVPADGLVLEATDCHVSEAALTGESFPVEKHAVQSPPGTPLARRANAVLLGTNVRSGTARCLIVATGRATEFGQIAHRLALRPPETEFDRGLRRFGALLTTAMLAMVLSVFVIHVFQGRPPITTLLFAIALAVGLSPELLPAILTVNLARAAQDMAKRGVLVRRLNAIENLGSMDMLCTDKTGTLTEGVVRLDGALDEHGSPSPHVLELAAINATLQTGLPSPLDDAILQARAVDTSHLTKLAEIPFDFTRKRVSIALSDGGEAQLLTKGAFDHVLEVCTALPDGSPLNRAARLELARVYEGFSREGIRVLGVATRTLPVQATYDRRDEQGLTFVGFLTFLDRPKEGVPEAIAALHELGVAVKLITGDSKLVAQHVARVVGLDSERVVTGGELDALHDEALWNVAERTDLFVEVDPNQKERILLALKKMGHVVGFLGDGVNDAPAMHAADTSLSVQEAVDVARAAADFVLLERSLDVIRRGVEQGRQTFANTLKYVLTTTSANLGNMVSMALASLFLPFLPLTAGQILLNNFLSDIPAVGIADDNVDAEMVAAPRRWNMRSIARFMVEFGALSSAFDMLTFALLLRFFHAAPEAFRTAWFVESLLTELAIALVVRTRRPFFRSQPGRILLASTLALIPLTFAIPFMAHAEVLGFVPLAPGVLAAVAGITVLYVLATELMKRWYYRREPA